VPGYILVVEDHAALAELYRLLLKDQGYDVFAAEDLARARARLAYPPPPALALVDVMLPDGSGLDLCRELRARWPSLPILVATARTEAADCDAARAAGATEVLNKYRDSERLEAVVARFLAGGSPSSP